MKNERYYAEYYFIQLLFCSSRDLLFKKNRKLYDVLFKRYLVIYKDGREKRVDIKTIADKFLKTLGV